MAALIDNIGPFDKKSEKFGDYDTNRFEAYVAANDIDNDKKVNVFLAVIGPDACKLLKNLCGPENPNTKTSARLSQLLQEHFEPTPIVIAERHKFWTASQEESGSVSEFVVRLEKLASTCSFGAFLSQTLRDRLVSGLHPKVSTTQRHLLSIKELAYSMAHDKCIADEMAGKANIEHMRDSANRDAEKVQQVYSRRKVEQNSKRPAKCKSCGSMQHGSQSCRFKNATCHHCQKKGHIHPICKARLSQMQFKGRSSGKKESKANSCDSISDDESVGSCEKHARDTPMDAAEDMAFGLYRTGTEQLSAESIKCV